MNKLAATMAALVLLLTSACGGGGRPSEGEVKEAFQSGMDQLGAMADSAGKMTDKAAACMAKALHGSKLSDEALRAMVDKDKEFKPSKEDEKALSEAAPQFVKCIPGMADLQKQLEDN